eukprot:scaffold236_cov117-Skeletonema_dohrnii-CCMP3373.AAC.1
MTTPFFLDDASSSSRIMSMSMSDRQSQLVLQRRQIIRQNSQVKSSNHSTNGSLRKVEARDEARDCEDSKSSPAHRQVVVNRATSEGNTVHSPSELSCTSTAVKHTRVAKKRASDDKSKSTESCDEISNDAEKENNEALNLLARELDRKKKELEETRAKLEEKEKAELDQLRNDEKKLQLHTSFDAHDDSRDGTRNEIANVSTRYSSGGSTTGGSIMGGSDSGYKRYLDAYHHQPKPLLTKQQSDATRDTSDYLTSASDISDLSGSRRLSSTSSSRPISRAARRSQESSSSSSFAPTMVSSSTTVPTNTSSRAAQKQSLEEVSNNQEQELHSTKSASISRSLPSLQQQLRSITNANLDDPVVMRSILMNPCPKDGGMVQCCIRRNKGAKAALGLGLFPEYRCYLRGTNNSRTETFLMTAKKRAANKTSNYLISMGRNDHDKDSKNILGKLRGNFIDTEYILYDHGKNPEDCSQERKNDGGCARIELGAILYAPSSSLGSKGPRTISVGISNVDKEGSPVKVWQPLHKRDDSMLDCLKKIDEDQMSSKEQKQLVHLQSKPPAWDEAMQRFFLNFNGRVTMASVKNFQLVDDKGDMCLQFGRTGKDEFILDVQWPLSPFQAFALALSSFDSKVGCD